MQILCQIFTKGAGEKSVTEAENKNAPHPDFKSKAHVDG
jgi:hypothetical protein